MKETNQDQAINCAVSVVRRRAGSESGSGGCKANSEAGNSSGAGDVSPPGGFRISNPPRVVCYAVPQWWRRLC